MLLCGDERDDVVNIGLSRSSFKQTVIAPRLLLESRYLSNLELGGLVEG